MDSRSLAYKNTVISEKYRSTPKFSEYLARINRFYEPIDQWRAGLMHISAFCCRHGTVVGCHWYKLLQKIIAMSDALTMIAGIYTSLEQGNIGKLVTALDNSVSVQTARCLGGKMPGREGILKLIPVFYRPNTGIKKTVEFIGSLDNKVVVLGNIRFAEADKAPVMMPFTDIWFFDNDRISAVIFYYRDPQELCDFLFRDQVAL